MGEGHVVFVLHTGRDLLEVGAEHPFADHNAPFKVAHLDIERKQEPAERKSHQAGGNRNDEVLPEPGDEDERGDDHHDGEQDIDQVFAYIHVFR